MILKRITAMTMFMMLFLLILAVPDIYVWSLYVRPSGSLLAKAVWWLPAIAAFAAAGAWFAGFYADWLMRCFFVILLCFALPKLLFMLFSLVGLGAGRWLPSAHKWCDIAGAVAGVAMCCCSIYGLTAGLRRLEVREVEVEFGNLPAAFDGYRIVHLSDLHTGTFGDDTSFLEQLVERVNGLQADAVVFTGDLVNVSPAELGPHAAVLSGLRARDGVWSVLGNHDYCHYARYDTPDGAAAACAQVVDTERAMGWRVLMNECAMIERGDGRIAIVGVENTGRPPFPSRGDLTKAVAGLEEDVFRILLTHDPFHWRYEVLPREAAELTLSGHTHAMQFEVLGFSPSSWSYPEWGGLYREGRRMLYVSKGVGGTAPFRFGAWPEIIVLTLRRSE